MLKPLLTAFDFDNTLVEGHALDTIVELGGKGLGANLTASYSLTEDPIQRTRALLKDLQKNKGVTAQQIREAVQRLPLTPGMGDVLRFLKTNNCEIILISDMISVTIQDWLDGSDVGTLVDRVYTNLGRYNSEGFLELEAYHEQDWCDMSFRSLCKGTVLDDHVRKRSEEGVTFTQVAYFGDGKNDLCPMWHLSKTDLAFPRKGFKLMEMFENKYVGTERVKASIHPWSSGQDILEVLRKFVK
uniref:(California timema) hypothetical protein n=1 Tax=Timema californicum TaxID=61474 RepID=A0A7R9IV01_TIMCA|nr:unnamed protein product [Timema californicum]